MADEAIWLLYMASNVVLIGVAINCAARMNQRTYLPIVVAYTTIFGGAGFGFWDAVLHPAEYSDIGALSAVGVRAGLVLLFVFGRRRPYRRVTGDDMQQGAPR